MPEVPESRSEVPPEARDAVLAAPVDYKRGCGLGLQIKEHWRKYRPRMFRELDQAATLDEAVHTAEALTVSAYDQAIRAGLAPDQARELVREEWAFLPDEDDVRHLAPERDPRNLASPPGKIEDQPPASPQGPPGRGRTLRRLG